MLTNLDKAAQLDPPGAGKYFYNMGALLVNSAQNEAAMREKLSAALKDIKTDYGCVPTAVYCGMLLRSFRTSVDGRCGGWGCGAERCHIEQVRCDAKD